MIRGLKSRLGLPDGTGEVRPRGLGDDSGPTLLRRVIAAFHEVSDMEMRDYIAMLKPSLGAQWQISVMRLRNAKTIPQTLYIEPPGFWIAMDPDGEYNLVYWASDFNHAEIDYEQFRDQWPIVETIEQGLIVWLTRDAYNVAALQNGRPLWSPDVDLAPWLR